MGKIKEDNEYVWKSNTGDVYIPDMETSHIKNTLNMINDMINKGRLDDYPIQYDTLFNELANRGYETDGSNKVQQARR